MVRMKRAAGRPYAMNAHPKNVSAVILYYSSSENGTKIV